ncbi:MAG TPA: PTS ascorbate transporter subunit IIC, partial [Pasteurellaceae bacterium]|nr:PTS ascorbate transporter subunit IIC [Pasteurellaceae bacterium]
GATAGVFGNATGGRLGAILGAFAHGLLITFLPVFLLPVLGSLGFSNTTFSDTDFGVIGITLGYMAQYLSKDVIMIVISGIFGGLVAYNYIAKEPVTKDE